MKAITEERLIAERKKYVERAKNLADKDPQFTSTCIYMSEKLIDECQEIDTLTVSKLRPMCESPLIDGFMVKLKTDNDLHEANFDSLGNVWMGEMYVTIDECEGWIPMPIYKPEGEV